MIHKFTIALVSLVLINLFELTAQSSYGYLGKTTYLKGAISASPAPLSKNLDGELTFLRFNVIGNIELGKIINRKNVIAANYRYFANIAHVSSSHNLDQIDYKRYTIGYFKFRSHEVGASIYFFNKGLDAPLGIYQSLGLGLMFSKFDTPFLTLSHVSTSGEEPKILSFDNSKTFLSPMLRVGLGKQTVFGKRFVFDVGVDFCLNLAYMKTLWVAPFNSPTNTAPDFIDQHDMDLNVKNSIQRRIFWSNLLNFKMGLSMLIF